MSQIKRLDSGAIWICKDCNIWWGSQVGRRPSTNFLFKLNKAHLLPPWDAYRGWRNLDEQTSVCKECGRNALPPALQAN